MTKSSRRIRRTGKRRKSGSGRPQDQAKLWPSRWKMIGSPCWRGFMAFLVPPAELAGQGVGPFGPVYGATYCNPSSNELGRI